MVTQLNPHLLSFFEKLSRAIGSVLLVLGCIVFVGWQFDIAVLKSVLPGLATMKANTSVGFLLAGLALLLEDEKKAHLRLFAVRVCAGIVTLLGLLTMVEYISGLNLGIDQLLFKDLLTPETSHPGRMSLTTALNFGLLGTAILVLDIEIQRGIRLAQFLTLIAGGIASVALIGYLYGVEPLYRVGVYSSMALHTALGFALFVIGVLCSRPQAGLMKIVSTEAIGGIALRRLLPIVIVAPVIIGWLRLLGQQAGYYDTNFGLALMVLLSVAALSITIWLNAGWLNLVDVDRRQAEEALRGSEDRFRLIVEAAPSAMVIVDREGKINLINSRAQELFGYRQDELLGRPVEILVPERFRGGHTKYQHDFQKQPASRPMGAGRGLYGLRKDGTEIPIEIGLAPHDSPGGLFTLAQIVDMSERKQAEEDIRRLNEELEQRVIERTQQLELANRELEDNRMEIQSIFDSMTTLNAKVALDGRLLLVNRIAAQASGLPLEKLMKTNFLEGQWWVFDPDVQARVKAAFARACLGTPVNYDEKIFVFGQVSTINFSLTPMLGSDGLVEYILAEGRDVTKLKEIEESLSAKTAQLEAANRELDAFSYSVSHDLRAPLRSIDGFSQALLEDYSQLLPEDGRNYLERVRKAAQRMAALIDDMLNLSRVTRAPMKAASVDLSRLAQGIAAEIRRTEPERRVAFIMPSNLKARGDAHLVSVVLQNLLSNAWKYTSKRELAEIEFGAKWESGETVYFIRDNGAGFDMAYADKLFGAFQRLHAMTDFPGTGVGLATVQRIIHRHGGRIWADAQVDLGATFFFTLPDPVRGKPRVVPQEEDSIARRVREIV